MKFIYLIICLLLMASGCNPMKSEEKLVLEPISHPQTTNEILNPTTTEATVNTATNGKNTQDLNLKTSPQGVSISYSGEDGKTALELLKSKHKVETKTYSGLGEYVESIDGVKPQTGYFWKFYVNGQGSRVGASSFVTKNTDVLEWKLDNIE